MAISLNKFFKIWKDAFARGVFSHEMSFILELPWRNIVLSPKDLVKRLPLTKTSRVLEVGAGSGFYSVAVAQAIPDGKLELLDLQEEMLEKARLKMESTGLKNVSYTLANAGGQIPFETESFDVVFMVTVLGEVKDRESLVRGVNRLLRGNGILSISEHLPDPDFVSFKKLRKLLDTNGFRFSRRFGKSWAYAFQKI